MINETKVRRYCSEFEKIENYDKAMTDMEHTWDCHHRLEIGQNGERISMGDLISHGLYYNRPASELIFLTHSEHQRLHHIENQLSEEIRRKISESHKGKPGGHLGHRHSEETRKKVSESLKEYWAKKKAGE